MKNTMIVTTLFFCAVISGCNGLSSAQVIEHPSSKAQATGIMIIYPYEGEHLGSGKMCDVKSETSSPDTLKAVSLLVNGSLYRNDVFTGSFSSANVYLPWTPKAPGIYTLQTILEERSGTQTSSNIVTVYVDDAPPPNDPTLDITVTPTLNEEECPDPMATTTAFANCRSGPGTAYSIVEGLKPGRSFVILGRSFSGNWWQVDREGSSVDCWIWAKLVGTCGNTDKIEIVSTKEMDEAGAVEEQPDEEPEEPIIVAPNIPPKDPGTGPTTPN